MTNSRMDQGFYDREVVAVARELIGKVLVRVGDGGTARGRIVETEAYLPKDDPANHGHRGRTRRNATMFGPPGFAYVYAIHSRWCLNVVTGPAGVACAVLIRAIEPTEGQALMRRRRGMEKLIDLARGPARLCEALAIDRRHDGLDLTASRKMWIEDDGGFDSKSHQIIETPRIGVTAAKELLLRFVVANNPFASGPRWMNSPAKTRNQVGRKRG